MNFTQYPPVFMPANNTLAVGSGAQFDVYFDGLGVTQALIGLTPTAGSPIPLNGAGAGLSITWSAGNAVNNDSWKATCSALADQSGNSKHATQATAAAQPVVTIGLNGKVGLLFDGVDDLLTYTLALPVSTSMYGIVRTFTVPAGISCVCGDINGNPGISVIGLNAALRAYQGGGGSNTSVTVANPSTNRIAASYSVSASDYQWIGSNKQTAQIGISGGMASRGFGGFPALSGFIRLELFCWITYPGVGTSMRDAAEAVINTAAGYGPGNVLV